MNKIFDKHVENNFPQKGVEKAQFSVMPLPFCKPNNKLFLNMQNMAKNIKANCDLVNESIDTCLQIKKKWILIRKHWYRFK